MGKTRKDRRKYDEKQNPSSKSKKQLEEYRKHPMKTESQWLFEWKKHYEN